MTARASIARLADDAPIARPESWVAKPPPQFKWPLELEVIWRENMARRDADAKKYGEPRTPREFYRGRKS